MMSRSLLSREQVFTITITQKMMMKILSEKRQVMVAPSTSERSIQEQLGFSERIEISKLIAISISVIYLKHQGPKSLISREIYTKKFSFTQSKSQLRKALRKVGRQIPELSRI